MAVALDSPNRPGPRPPSSSAPLRATIGVEDVAETSALLATVVGLRVHAVTARGVSLGDPAEDRPFLCCLRRPAHHPVDTVVCRLTFRVASEPDLRAAGAHAARCGAIPLRALQDDFSCAVHFEGPGGIEIGFVHRIGAWNPVEVVGSRPRSLAVERLTGRSGFRRAPVSLDHVSLGRTTRHERRPIAGTCAEDLGDGMEAVRTLDGRAAAIAARRDHLPTAAVLLTVG